MSYEIKQIIMFSHRVVWTSELDGGDSIELASNFFFWSLPYRCWECIFFSLVLERLLSTPSFHSDNKPIKKLTMNLPPKQMRQFAWHRTNHVALRQLTSTSLSLVLAQCVLKQSFQQPLSDISGNFSKNLKLNCNFNCDSSIQYSVPYLITRKKSLWPKLWWWQKFKDKDFIFKEKDAIYLHNLGDWQRLFYFCKTC